MKYRTRAQHLADVASRPDSTPEDYFRAGVLAGYDEAAQYDEVSCTGLCEVLAKIKLTEVYLFLTDITNFRQACSPTKAIAEAVAMYKKRYAPADQSPPAT